MLGRLPEPGSMHSKIPLSSDNAANSLDAVATVMPDSILKVVELKMGRLKMKSKQAIDHCDLVRSEISIFISS